MAERKRKSIAEEAYEALYGRRKNRTKDGYCDGCDDHEYNYDDDDDDCYCE